MTVPDTLYTKSGDVGIERTAALMLFGIFATRAAAADYPRGATREARDREIEELERSWTQMDVAPFAPSEDETFKRRLATYFRRSASPGAAVALMRMATQIDVREVLASIRTPTLILHRVGDLVVKVEEGRWIARKIPGARYVELPGDGHTVWAGDVDAVVDEIEEFLTGRRSPPDPDRLLATVLFTDIVSSTQLVAQLGDWRWRELLDRHHQVTRRELERFRGREVDFAGDGVLATFDGPARAVRCAWAIAAKGTEESERGKALLQREARE